MGSPTEFAKFTITVRDQNNLLITGSTVELKITGTGSVSYTLTESADRPGTYYHDAVECGRLYDIYKDGSLMQEWAGIPFGSGVGRDRIFLEEHDAAGQHTTINCTRIIWR